MSNMQQVSVIGMAPPISRLKVNASVEVVGWTSDGMVCSRTPNRYSLKVVDSQRCSIFAGEGNLCVSLGRHNSVSCSKTCAELLLARDKQGFLLLHGIGNAHKKQCGYQSDRLFTHINEKKHMDWIETKLHDHSVRSNSGPKITR